MNSAPKIIKELTNKPRLEKSPLPKQISQTDSKSYRPLSKSKYPEPEKAFSKPYENNSDPQDLEFVKLGEEFGKAVNDTILDSFILRSLRFEREKLAALEEDLESQELQIPRELIEEEMRKELAMFDC